MKLPAIPTPAYGSRMMLTMWAARNAIVNTSRFSCHGKIRFDNFHVERLTGWLRIRPLATTKVRIR